MTLPIPRTTRRATRTPGTRDRTARAAAATAVALALLGALGGCGGAGEERTPPARAWTDPGETTAGEWTLYYNAYASADLDPAMAKAYGVVSRPRAALVSVSLTRGGDPRAAADASVEIAARTLIGQAREVKTRRIARDGVVSWLGELDAGDREQLVFTVRANVPGASAPLVAEFRREFHGGG
jgi:hypothetical protein